MPLDTIADFRFETALAGSHPILRDHHVHDQPLVPGVTWLDLIWQALGEYGFAGEALILENIVFPHALSVAPGAVAEIALTYDAQTRGFSITSEAGDKVHCRCRLADDLSAPAPPPPELPPPGTMIARQLTEVYAGARALSIRHGPWMAGEGTAYLGEDLVVADIALSDEAMESATSHKLHPALMDCATVVPFAAGGFGISHSNPAIPLAIRRVYALRPGFARARVVCRLSQTARSNDDILHNDLWLLDESGNSLCVIEALSAKRIRAAGTLTSAAAAPEPGAAAIAPAQTGLLHDELAAFIIANSPCKQIADSATGFFDLGLGSADLLSLAARLDAQIDPQVYPTLLYEYPSPDALAGWLEAQGVTRLSALPPATIAPASPEAVTPQFWTEFVTRTVCAATGLMQIPDPQTPFFDLGLDSAAILALAGVFEEALGTSLYPTLGYEHGNVAALAAHFRDSGLTLPASREGARPESRDAPPQAASAASPAHCRHDLAITWTPYQPPHQAPDLRGWYRLDTGTPFEELPVRDDMAGIAGLVWKVAAGDTGAALAEALTLCRSLITTAQPLRLMVLCPDPVIALALTGFLRSLARETPRISGRVLTGGSEGGLNLLPAHDSGFDLVAADSDQTGSHLRQSLRLDRSQADDDAQILMREPAGGILVSGGHGAIALHLVEALIGAGARRFALLARRPAEGESARAIAAWRERGIEVVSLIADLTDSQACARACRAARARFGEISGVIHCAGILRDGLILAKDPADAQAVLAAKYETAVQLEALTRADPLAFFAACGSISGVAGNLGQADYAFANAALAGLMQQRENRVARGEARGRSLCLHWPLWAEGAMAPPAERLRQLDRETGLGALPTRTATRAFLEALTGDADGDAATPLWLDPAATERLKNHLAAAGLAPDEAPATGIKPLAHGTEPETGRASSAPHATSRATSRATSPATPPPPRPEAAAEPIAVIGLAGEYPGARDVTAFWDNLMAGRDCITPVPTERWDTEALPDAQALYAREGGFIADHDRFDAAFFGIPPREADVLDPQERRFLQIAWQAIEAAGYVPRRLAGSDTGVFVGTMWGQYQLHATSEPGTGAASIFAAIANRVSYTLDLSGPSLAIDSMCSSALSAIHLAVSSLRRGECGMAIAGGVNLMSHPHKYRFLCQNRMLSADGRCRSFGAGGDGYVPGEGVGAVILKPLAQAQADGDPVLAVITGSAINHGGRGAGMTVPNPAAQAKVIAAAHAEARSDAPVSYIEAHGTGTALGDPIEIQGLHKALGESAANPCAIGSVKSNIGHLEGAAGIAALTKVVLQLRHATLAPSLHAETPNPKLAIDDGPFRIQTQAGAWQPAPARVQRAAQTGTDPAGKRVAGISAFGAGGANAHLVIEEPPARPVTPARDDRPALLVISARDGDALARYVDAWIAFLDRPQHDPFEAVATTSIVAREACTHRLAVIAADAGEAAGLLRRWRASGGEAGALLSGDNAAPSSLRSLAEAWIAGDTISAGPDLPSGRVPIPVYPFAGERHWLPLPRETEILDASATPTADTGCPLLHRRHPAISGLRAYDSDFAESEPLLGAHRIADECLMPAAMMLACVAAAARHLPDQPLHISEARIGQPWRAGKSTGLRTELFPHGDGHVVELRAGSEGPLVMQAFLARDAAPAPVAAQVPPDAGESCAAIYNAFAARGLAYGEDFRRLLSLRRGADDLLVTLRPVADPDWRGAILCMDAAMQAVALADDAIAGDVTIWLPDAFSGVIWHGDPGQARFARVRRGEADAHRRCYDIALIDAEGQILWQAERFTLKARGGAAGADAGASAPAAAPAPLPLAGPAPFADPADTDELRQAVRSKLCTMLAAESGLSARDIRRGNGFVALGVDSVMVMNMTARLEEQLGTLPKSLFFEHPGIRELTDWLLAGYAPALRAMLANDDPQSRSGSHGPATPPAAPGPAPDTQAPLRSLRPDRGNPSIETHGLAPDRKVAANSDSAVPDHGEPLAVIGMAGRFPQAPDIEALWHNLVAGHEAVGPVPQGRWPAGLDGAFDPSGQWRSFRGGFLDDVAGFDAAFFNMTPAEAERADPTERLMLETAWSCAEHAGYSRKTLSGKNIGVFVASMWQHYQHYGVDAALSGARKTTKSMLSAAASRVAGMLGVTGPCIALETMCSGGLTGLHLARRAIAAGDCEAALVGGVNLSLHPLKFRTLTEDGFLSASGHCAAFGAGADGYVPCEAVAGIFVKPLSRARADGDPIHGLILGSAVNHNGGTNGSTAPSASAQSAVIMQALGEAGIDAHRISYVEASGTCTRLGDPIELEGLEAALSAGGRHPGCAIGSIKSNLGHAEAASGLAGMIKVLLQLRHEQLAPTLHIDAINPALGLDEKPFTLVDTADAWQPGTAKYAAISAFGAGGSNAHAIIASAPAITAAVPVQDAPRLVPVSAHSETALDAQLEALTAWLAQNPDADLTAIAATLALGREDQPCRIAFTCRDTRALRAAIEAFRAGRHDSPALCLPVEAPHGELDGLFDDADGRTLIDTLIAQGRHGKLGRLWSSGVNIDWQALFEPGQQRLSLPGSAFERRPCLVDHGLARHAGTITNLSDLHRQAYRVRLTAGHPAIADHVIGETRQVSLALMLRLVETVLAQADPQETREITLEATRPWLLQGDLDCEVEVTPAHDALQLSISVDGTVYALARAGIVRQTGTVSQAAAAVETNDDIASDQATGEALYSGFASDGYRYGAAYRAITGLEHDADLVTLSLHPLAGTDPWSDAAMPPGIIDAGLQAARPFLPQDPTRRWLPVRLAIAPPLTTAQPRSLHVTRRESGSGELRLTLSWYDAGGMLVRTARADLAAQRIAPERDRALILTRTPIPLAGDEALPRNAPIQAPAGVICIACTPDDTADAAVTAVGDADAAEAALPADAAHVALCLGPQAAHGTSPDALWRLVRRARENRIAALDILVHAEAASPHLEGLRAWFAALNDEIPQYRGRISISAARLPLADLLATGARRAILATRLSAGGWEEPGSGPPAPLDSAAEAFSARGEVVLITGGAGGLGRVFAQHLAQRHGAHIVLAGRRAADDAITQFIGQLREAGSDAAYYAADITDPEDMQRLRRLIGMRYGCIDGAIHAAGVTQDAWIVEQSPESVARVLAPKVAGTLSLIGLLRDFAPRWVAGFGSLSGYLGNAGQSDYSYANAFMNAALTAALGERCKVIGLSWPLWRDLGIQPAPAMIAAMAQRYGLEPLPAATGIALFEELMAGPSGNHLVGFGDPVRIEAWLAGREAGIRAQDQQAAAPRKQQEETSKQRTPSTDARQIAREWVAKALSAETGIDAQSLDWRRPIDQFGLSSPDATGLAARLSRACGKPLAATLLYGFRDFGALAADLERYVADLPGEAGTSPQPVTPMPAPSVNTGRAAARGGYRLAQPRPDLAIIGTACRMPGAQDMAQFWNLLAQGRDAVTPIPQSRWDWQAFAAQDDREAMKGGFLEGIAHFDYPFFGISHREACAMDPQERIVLETAWHALEDAGIVPSALAGRPVGVYMGAMWNQYQLLARDHWRAGAADTHASATLAAIANRLSFLLDLNGPSLTLDTMCSSSLMALKLACDALRLGEIELAIVGGVNLSVHPFKYRQLQQGLFLSPQGRCGAFADGGDGYVPAEGAGIVVLRRAPEAQATGERIHALVKGIGVSHGGRANGFTVPRPQQQAQAIRAALADAAIAPSSVSYVEAHGTGTALGDPIELDGLRRAYMEDGAFPLAIGSVKANIGHAEAAAGMAALAKVIGQFAHRSLAPSIHCDPINPRLALEGSGISIPKALMPWQPDLPEQAVLRAGISGFGAGGTNVHVILEEPPAPACAPGSPARAVEIVTLSASGEAALRKLCGTLRQHIESGEIGPLSAIAATSQLHREALRYRVAFCVATREALDAALAAWLAGIPGEETVSGRIDLEDEAPALRAEYGDFDAATALARHWVRGGAIDWHPLWPEGSPRTQLPHYPFRELPVWLDEGPALADIARNGTGEGRRGVAVTAQATTPPAAAATAAPARAAATDPADLEAAVRAAIAAVLRIDADDLDATMPFDRIGMDSITARDCASALSQRFAIAMDATWFFNHPSLRQLSRALAAAGADHEAGHEAGPVADVALDNNIEPESRNGPVAAPVDQDGTRDDADAAGDAIAIIGISGAFAGAEDLTALWNNLAAGADCVTEIAPERWDIDAYYDPRPDQRGRTISRRMGQLDGVGSFDPVAYGLMPDEALAMDPKQRLFLKHAGLALENAGIASDALDGSDCGVFAGTMAGSYRTLLAESGEASEALAMLGNHAAALPARVAYWLNLTGPTLAVDTACSSSLVAIHLACRAIAAGECGQALAGGVFVAPGPHEQVASSQAGMLSPAGRCKTFDDAADGIAIGEGVGVVMLKRLDQALADGDPIHAVIRASGINQDGRTNGITAPNALSQARLIRRVLGEAGLSGADLDYLECHGTGTRLGDPVEIEGLRLALDGQRTTPLPVGSVKPNIGHCYAAAGMASLFKVVLGLEHEAIAPNIGMTTPNTLIDFDKAGVSVPTGKLAWPRGARPRRAAVSAFGYSGTNAHLVIEEAPLREAQTRQEAAAVPQLVVLSGRKPAMVVAQARRLAAHIAEADPPLDALAHTLASGRKAEPWRAAFIVGSNAEAIGLLSDLDEDAIIRVGKTTGADAFPAEGAAELPAHAPLPAHAALRALARDWLAGRPVTWPVPQCASGHRLSLPAKPLAEKIYWPKQRRHDDTASPDDAPGPRAGEAIAPAAAATSAAPAVLRRVSRETFRNAA